MNIRLKAGLEVAGIVVSALLVGSLMRLALDYFSGIYGEERVVQGIVVLVVVSFSAFMLKLMYDIRVAQLAYHTKLNNIVNK
jgi:hypothetical protein